jgi:hypothetical protein
MGGNGNDMEALSPRDANAQRSKPQELKKAVANLKANRAKGEKETHPPPPPSYVTEPPCRDRREGAVYEIRNCLGKGGFAICYEGKLNGTSKRYALKIVKSTMPIKMEQKVFAHFQLWHKPTKPNMQLLTLCPTVPNRAPDPLQDATAEHRPVPPRIHL